MPPGCGGLCIAINFTFLVIVDIIYIDGVPVLEAKGHTPTPGHGYSIVAFQVSL